METNIYAVQDIKAETYGMPVYYPNNVEALRSFEQAAKDPNTTINKYPSDYNMVLIGKYNTIDGEIEIFSKKTILANASSYLQ